MIIFLFHSKGFRFNSTKTNKNQFLWQLSLFVSIGEYRNAFAIDAFMSSNAHDVFALILWSNGNALSIYACVSSNTDNILAFVFLDAFAVLAYVTLDTQLVTNFLGAFPTETHFPFGAWLFTQRLILVTPAIDTHFTLGT